MKGKTVLILLVVIGFILSSVSAASVIQTDSSNPSVAFNPHSSDPPPGSGSAGSTTKYRESG
jgi:hypothetical protein